MRRALVRALAVVLAIAPAACLGRVETAGSTRTLPFHVHQDRLARFPRLAGAALAAPAPVTVGAQVELAPFVAYYPLPVGLAVRPPAYNEATKWAPIELSMPAEEALRQWFARGLHGGSGPRRTVRAVVTDFQWYMLGAAASGGRIATRVVVTDEAGAIVYTGDHVTEARVPFVDALFRAHLKAWLGDRALVAALDGGAS